MVDRAELAKIYVKAQADGTDDSIAVLEPHLADDMLIDMALGPVEGKEAALRQMRNPVTMYNFTVAAWDEPVADGDGLKMACAMPATATLGGFNLRFNFTDDGQLQRVHMRPFPAPPLPASELALTDEMKQAIAAAPGAGSPVLIIAVDADGQPRVSIPTSVVPLGDTQLAYWARNLGSDEVQNLAARPRVTCWYRNGTTRDQLAMYGTATTEASEEARNQVYDSIAPSERWQNPERQGGPVIVDLDEIQGVMSNSRINMRRS